MVSLLLFWWYGKKEMGDGEEGKGGGRVTQVMYHSGRRGVLPLGIEEKPEGVSGMVTRTGSVRFEDD